MDLYKCPSCGATEDSRYLYERSIGDGYVCNNCLDHIMVWIKPEEKKKK
jgi:DNA-directed RNA polymerase subunit RPC12/RpoP